MTVRSAASHANDPRQTITRARAGVRSRARDRGGSCRARLALVCSPEARSAPRPRRSVLESQAVVPMDRLGWFAYPARCIARNSQSPERSPVNIRPVRFPPCAAGASPTTKTRALGSPKPGRAAPSSPRRRRTPSSCGDLFAPRDQAGTKPAVDDRFAELHQCVRQLGDRPHARHPNPCPPWLIPAPNHEPAGDGRSRSPYPSAATLALLLLTSVAVSSGLATNRRLLRAPRSVL